MTLFLALHASGFYDVTFQESSLSLDGAEPQLGAEVKSVFQRLYKGV